VNWFLQEEKGGGLIGLKEVSLLDLTHQAIDPITPVLLQEMPTTSRRETGGHE